VTAGRSYRYRYRGGWEAAEPRWLPCAVHRLGREAAPVTGLCPACLAEELVAAGWEPGPRLRVWLELAELRRRRAAS
jgi:hypothetical protein